MPAKSAWHGRLDEIVSELEALPMAWVTRGAVEFLLGVGPRRAQQIMAPCAVEQIGSSVVADRTLLVARLRALAEGEAGGHERRRRQKLAITLDRFRREWLERPKVLVEAPVSVINQRFENLPAGVQLFPGRVTIEFQDPAEALQKMLMLAMAIGRDMARFEELVAPAVSPGPAAADAPAGSCRLQPRRSGP